MNRTTILLTASLIALISQAAPAEDVSRAAGTGASFKGPLGLQLYSLRDEFKKDVPATLAKVHGFGFRTVELAGTYGKSADEFNALLAYLLNS